MAPCCGLSGKVCESVSYTGKWRHRRGALWDPQSVIPNPPAAALGGAAGSWPAELWFLLQVVLQDKSKRAATHVHRGPAEWAGGSHASPRARPARHLGHLRGSENPGVIPLGSDVNHRLIEMNPVSCFLEKQPSLRCRESRSGRQRLMLLMGLGGGAGGRRKWTLGSVRVPLVGDEAVRGVYSVPHAEGTLAPRDGLSHLRGRCWSVRRVAGRCLLQTRTDLCRAFSGHPDIQTLL